MKTLVTGADGLLGSHVVRELLSRGAPVRVMVQPGSESPTLRGLEVEQMEGDLLDAGSLRAAVAGVDRVVHCAAVTDQFAPAKLHWAVNFEGTRNLVRACLEADSPRLVAVGSASALEFGTKECPGDESGGFPAQYAGLAYMESKAAAMAHVREQAASHGLDAVVVAPTFMLGEHDWRPSSGRLVLEYLSRGLRVVPPGGRNFVRAGDAAVGVVNALDRGEPGDLTILAGHNLDYREFFEAVASCAGVAPPRAVVPRSVVLAAGRLGDTVSPLVERLGGAPVQLGSDMASLSVQGCYYDDRKAVGELDLPLSPIGSAVRDCLRGLRRYGHLDPDPLDGSVAIVSGASRGIGLATARALGARGARVVLTARGEARLRDSRELLEGEGIDCVAVAGDVGRWDDAEGMVRTAVDAFGRVDVVVNNAGVSMRGDFVDLSPQVCAETIGTNLTGTVYLTRAAAPHLVDSGGSIVFVSSIAGMIGLPGASTYCASKSALTALAESLRLELGPGGVHIGVAYVGFTEHDPEKRVLGADGQPMMPDRPAYQTQDQVAAEIVGLIDRRRRQVVLTPVGRLGELAHRLSPRLVESVIARAQAGDSRLFRQFA